MKERAENRRVRYDKLREQAKTKNRRLGAACDYLRACCSRLPAAGINDMIEIIEELAEKAGEFSDSQ